jgi:glyoxylase-like metal-dependent hydrolase (beta-lactamase superfamily II)
MIGSWGRAAVGSGRAAAANAEEETMSSRLNRIELYRVGRGGATRREFLGVSLLAAAGAVATAGAPGVALAGGRGLWQPSQEGLEWREVRGGVWVAIGGGGNSMLALSSARGGAGEALLVDTKLATFGPSLARQSRSGGRRQGTKLAMVINTHHHADHSGGNFAFTSPPGDASDDGQGSEERQRRWQAPRLVAHAKAEGRIRGQIERYQEQVRSALTGAGLPEEIRGDLQRMRQRLDSLNADAWAPKETIGDSAEWSLGEGAGEGDEGGGGEALKIEARHFGAGHTDNDIVVRLPQRNVLHAGDLLFHEMHPFFDPTGGVTCKGWIESVRRTIELCDDETVVIPGHGEVTDIDGLKKQAEYLEKLWDEVGKLVDAGTPREEAVQREWPFMQGLGRPQLRERVIGAVYDERAR